MGCFFIDVNNSKEIFDLVVIGGGAAGFFGAIQAAEMKAGLKIIILEKSGKLLSKVKVSGGGRCNVTHHCYNPFELARHYPRGERKLKEVFKVFQAKDMVQWLESKGVDLKTEADGRMFPVTDDSQTIIDCFLRVALDHKIKIELSTQVTSIEKESEKFFLRCGNGMDIKGKKILIAAGGNPNVQFYSPFSALGHSVTVPIPSLFTFNDPSKQFADLMGVAVKDAQVKIAATKFNQRGPVLITHWGLSGPAVIKLSAWAAVQLHAMNYQFTVLINWIPPLTEEQVKKQLVALKILKPKQRILGNPINGLPTRLWDRLCFLSEITEEKIWGELPQRNINKLIEFLIRSPFNIKGKTTFKEEFVTCGGVEVSELNIETMESKVIPGVYFAGEVLNIDGETGGFNFQAAWSTAYLAAKAIGNALAVPNPL